MMKRIFICIYTAGWRSGYF